MASDAQVVHDADHTLLVLTAEIPTALLAGRADGLVSEVGKFTRPGAG